MLPTFQGGTDLQVMCLLSVCIITSAVIDWPSWISSFFAEAGVFLEEAIRPLMSNDRRGGETGERPWI